MNIFRDRDGMWNLISLWYAHSYSLCLSGFMSILDEGSGPVGGVEWEVVER